MRLYNNQQRFVYMFQPVEKALNNKYDPLFLWFYEMLSIRVSEYCVLKNGGRLVIMNELPVLVFLETLQEKLVQKSFEISEISEVPEILSIRAKILIGIVPFVSYVLISKTIIAVITWWLGG